MPNNFYIQKQWRGLDLADDPADIGQGYLTDATNIFLDVDHALTTRPGKSGLLAAPLPAGCYAPLAYLKAGGAADAVFTAGGRLYHLPSGATAPQELALTGVAAGSINSPAAQVSRIGRYAYLVDGQGPLLRLDLTGGGTLTALAAPGSAPGAALASVPLDALTGAWLSDTCVNAATNRIVNPTFSGGSTTTQPGWTVFGADVDWHTPTGLSGNWALLDTPGEGISTTAALVNDALNLDAARRANLFQVGADLCNQDAQGRGSLLVTVFVYASADGSGPELGRLTREWAVPNNGAQASTRADLFNFGDVPTPIGSYRVQFTAGVNNILGASSIYLTNVVSYPTTAPVLLRASGQPAGGQVVSVGGTSSGPLAGLHLRYAPAAPLDLSTAAVLDLGLGGAPAGLAFYLRLQKSGDTAWYATNPVRVTADGHTAYVDATTVPLAVRRAVAALEVVFTADVALPPGQAFTLGPLTGAGNLSVGYADYSYLITEVLSAGDATLANVVESDPSPASAPLTPTVTQAEALVTAPAPANTQSDHLRVWRRGGVFSDGLARLVAAVPLAADVAFGSDPANPYYGWAHATRTLTDDTPDSFLLDPTTPTAVYGREAAPAGCQAVCAWQNRLALARGGHLYLSWLVQSDNQAALYFNSVNLPGDPLAAEKGASFAVGNDDGDPVVGLVPMGSNLFFRNGFLVVLKRNSVWLVGGTDPSNFYLQSYLLNAGDGLAAPRAVAIVGGKVWYLCADGVREFDGNFATPESVSVDRVLLPKNPDGTPALTPAALSQAWMLAHDRRLYLGVPGAADASPTTVWVYDTRYGAWTGRWTAMPFTGGASLSAAGAAYAPVFTGSDGQVYTLAGHADVAAPGAAPAPISFTVRGRAGGAESETPDVFRVKVAERVHLAVSAPSPVPVTFSVTSEAGVSWSQAYTVSGLATHRLKAAPWARGALLTLGAAGSASVPVKIMRLGLSLQPAGF